MLLALEMDFLKIHNIKENLAIGREDIKESITIID
jgi:hypothetical protein